MTDRIQQIAEWLSVFVAPGQVTELRALFGGKKVVSGFYSDLAPSSAIRETAGTCTPGLWR